MEFNNASFSRIDGHVGHNTNLGGQQRAFIIDVVVLDLTCPGQPVYQFNRETPYTDDELILIRQGRLSIPHDAFTPVGYAKTIDKTSKMITLSDQNTILYTHLITVSGQHPTLLSYEFIAGLNTLIDAIRVSKMSGNMHQLSAKQVPLDIQACESHEDKISAIGNYKLPASQEPNQTPTRSTFLAFQLNKKLYQVQI